MNFSLIEVKVIVDPENNIEETNEADNNLSVSYKFEEPKNTKKSKILGICGPTILIGLIMIPIGIIVRKLKN